MRHADWKDLVMIKLCACAAGVMWGLALPKKPFSDQKLSLLLKEKGFSISRRTVAKYREQMGIKGTYDRKIDSRI